MYEEVMVPLMREAYQRKEQFMNELNDLLIFTTAEIRQSINRKWR